MWGELVARPTDDACRLLDALGPEPIVWVGLSLGGMVGQELAGTRDQATPVAMAACIPGAKLALLDGAAHLSVLERPQVQVLHGLPINPIASLGRS